MRVLECFAGIGGFALAWERLGCEHAAFIEIDPFCQAVLRERFPGVPIHDDIKTFSAIPLRGQIDIISGGPPCQPASVVGKRKGHEDERWLWPEYLRLVRECSPRWVVAENPTGIVTLRPHGLDWICQELEAAGYQCCPVVVGADDVGAPHRRKRVFFLAHTWSERLEGERNHGTASRATDRSGGTWASMGAVPVLRELPMRNPRDTRARLRVSADRRMDGGPVRTEAAWYTTGSGVCRVAHGIPARVDRLRALGNAVVPQVAEAIGRAILAADEIPRKRRMTP